MQRETSIHSADSQRIALCLQAQADLTLRLGRALLLAPCGTTIGRENRLVGSVYPPSADAYVLESDAAAPSWTRLLRLMER